MGSLSSSKAPPPSRQGPSLESLEAEHVALILQFLPPSSVASFAATCRLYRRLATSDGVWSAVCRRQWGPLCDEVPEATWRRRGWAGLYKDVAALDGATWRRVDQPADAPRARASHSMAVVDGRLAVFGGGCHGGRHLDDTWLANPAHLLLPGGSKLGLEWQEAVTQDQPAGRFQQSCTVVGNSLLIFGGINDFGVRSNETWLFTVDHNRTERNGTATWSRLPVIDSPVPRGAHAASYAGGLKVVVFGGIGDGAVRLGDTWMLDLTEEPLTWRQLATANSPQPRSGHSLTWVGDDRLVLYGGRGAKLEVLSDVWVLELGESGSEPSWVRVEASHSPHTEEQCLHCPGPRAGHSATSILGGRVLIFGGEDGRRGRKSDVWVLDPQQEARSHSVNALKPVARGRIRVPLEEEVDGGFAVPDVELPHNGDLQVVPEIVGGEGEGEPKIGEREVGEVAMDEGEIHGRETAGGSEDGRMRGKEREGERGGEGGGRRERGQLWRLVSCEGETPSRRSYHGACALGGGCAVLVFGGMVDGEQQGHTATGLTFDDQFFMLQLTKS